MIAARSVAPARRAHRVPPRLRRALSGDAGSVTVEAAIGIASLVTVTVLAVGGLGAALTQVQLVDAAREAARVAAIEGVEAGRRAGRDAAPAAASVEVSAGERVTAVATARPLGLPVGQLRAVAVARPEPAG